jgi:hypothetical protein
MDGLEGATRKGKGNFCCYSEQEKTMTERETQRGSNYNKTDYNRLFYSAFFGSDDFSWRHNNDEKTMRKWKRRKKM